MSSEWNVKYLFLLPNGIDEAEQLKTLLKCLAKSE